MLWIQQHRVHKVFKYNKMLDFSILNTSIKNKRDRGSRRERGKNMKWCGCRSRLTWQWGWALWNINHTESFPSWRREGQASRLLSQSFTNTPDTNLCAWNAYFVLWAVIWNLENFIKKWPQAHPAVHFLLSLLRFPG